jgi:aspartyl-tRNA(Asn)/glutamyl-tRNA(Gln) amidotransferase subunit A
VYFSIKYLASISLELISFAATLVAITTSRQVNTMNLFPEPAETISHVADEIRGRRLSCQVLLARYLARIDDGESRIRAWVVVDRDGARRQAEQLDHELQAGKYRGPLHGIPIAIKDIFDVQGFGTAAGSKLLGKAPATQDAPLVKRLRDAGAVILGKTVTTQYASFDPPVTTNPWDHRRTPGGSSSGSAAAVAAGMCLGAMGSQTGGSITRPASYCGVAGLKPSYGQLDLGGVFPLAPSMDHPGPIARCVQDLALIYDVLAGTKTHFAAELSPPRLGLLRGHFQDHADAVVLMALNQALEALTQAGAKISETPLPHRFNDVIRQHRIIMACESAAYHEPRIKQHPDDFEFHITKLVTEGLNTPAPEYFRARQHQEQLKRDMVDCFEGVDALIMPATTTPPPDATSTGDPAFNSPWSYTGLPVVSFPVGLSADGLPIAIQLVGRHGDEGRLFQAALWCERVITAAAHAGGGRGQ